jgi:hypothetical protein
MPFWCLLFLRSDKQQRICVFNLPLLLLPLLATQLGLYLSNAEGQLLAIITELKHAWVRF